jgi:hypothetical protein
MAKEIKDIYEIFSISFDR